MNNAIMFSEKNIDRGALPNLIIIGAMKCGTTSLHHYLNLHPEISMSSKKELNFFRAGKDWQQGIEWYKSHFTNSTKIRGEASPSYSACHKWPGVASRIYSVVPEAKLIYILRDPVERIISQYMHKKLDGVEHRTINEALAQYDRPDNNYIVRSKYYLQLKEYLNYFSPQQILILTLEELSSHRGATLKKVFSYLEVDDSFKVPQIDKKIHQTKNKVQKNSWGFFISKMPLLNRVGMLPFDTRWRIEKLLYTPFSRQIEKPQLNPELRQQIIDLLREDIARLRDYTGDDFPEWCV